MTAITVELTKRGRTEGYVVHGDPRVEGELLPRVHSILGALAKPALVPWAHKEARRQMVELLVPWIGKPLTAEMLDGAAESARLYQDDSRDKAAGKGTALHLGVSELLKAGVAHGGPDGTATMAIVNWIRNNLGDDLDSEVPVYSAIYHYGGTVDIIAHTSLGLVIVDIKSGGIWPEHILQLGAYAGAVLEMGEGPLAEAWLIRPEGAEVAATKIEQVPLYEAHRAFLALKMIWEWQKGQGKP